MARAGLGRRRAGEKDGKNSSRSVTSSGRQVNNRKSFVDKSRESSLRGNFHLHYENLLTLASPLQFFPLWFGFQLRHSESGGKISTKHTHSYRGLHFRYLELVKFGRINPSNSSHF
jgi:hypothetical protein